MIAAMLLAGAVGAGADTNVAMAGKAFAPNHVTILVGERVSWTNQDSTSHTVTAADRTFDSGAIGAGGAYARRFAQPGVVEYKCTLHRSMQGTVEVVALELRAPDEPVPAGKPAELTGRTPAPGATVTLERVGRGDVATTVADEEGNFRFRVGTAEGPARYRARAGGLSSAAADVAVAPEVRVSARGGRHGISVRAHVPGQPKARIAIERYVRERFGFQPLRRVRLDAHSRAHVVLRSQRRLRLRVRLSHPVGGWARSVSKVVVVPRRGASHESDHH